MDLTPQEEHELVKIILLAITGFVITIALFGFGCASEPKSLVTTVTNPEGKKWVIDQTGKGRNIFEIRDDIITVDISSEEPTPPDKPGLLEKLFMIKALED